MFKSLLFLQLGICVMLAFVSNRAMAQAHKENMRYWDEIADAAVKKYAWLSNLEFVRGGNCKTTTGKCILPRKKIFGKLIKWRGLHIQLCLLSGHTWLIVADAVFLTFILLNVTKIVAVQTAMSAIESYRS